jgi:hypothetical protein
MGRERFPAAQALFESYGFSALDFCDIDEEPNEAQLARLDQYDIRDVVAHLLDLEAFVQRTLTGGRACTCRH